MLSLRDIIDFASMSEDLAQELNNPNVGLPDLGAVVAGHTGALRACSATPCAANDIESD
ncbi:hypothetical protein [Thalassospira sp.]|uniref:hypothetical protein n=1 Tax=Thalassospira sp. TaxID=1912094 RepID=UPI001B286B5D|nr:hypothetical protein [Thalassospira sp.]MBO6807807.1 hypothetical protein [Thalassospira sp.]MBO6840983.1 hypothetical protein [Thalassospira sp.]